MSLYNLAVDELWRYKVMTVLVQGTTEMTLTVLNEGSTAVAETCRVSTL